MSSDEKIVNLLSSLMDGNVVLPNIQRGFVWKTSQIESLWDSMLRGYPIGAFTVQEKSMQKSILDGQQRLTALALGFGIKNNNLKAGRSEDNKFKIFIDLYNPQCKINNFENYIIDDMDMHDVEKMYYVKVITDYHPWGYQFNDNEKTLESHHIDAALTFFGEVKSNKPDVSKRFKSKIKNNNYPYDTYFPVPLECFVNIHNNKIYIATVKEIDSNICDWIESLSGTAKYNMLKIYYDITKKSENYFSSIQNEVQNFQNDKIYRRKKDETTKFKKDILLNVPTLRLKDYLKKRIENPDNFEKIEFYSIEKVRERLEKCLSMNVAFIKIDDYTEELQSSADVEHIFERLNRGGTPITLEELNYSLFKSKLGNSSEVINKFEDACKIISPAKFLPIMFRLYQHSQSNQSPNSLRIKSKDFKRGVLKGELDAFSIFLEKAKTYLSKYENIMIYDESSNKNGLPYPLLVKIINEAPELLFMILYRLFVRKPNDLKEDKNKIIFLSLTLYWFFGGNPRKLYPQLLSTVFPSVKFLSSTRFYSYELLQRAMLHLGVEKFPVTLSSDLEKLKKKKDIQNYSIFQNRDIILYAQRHALDLWFKSEYFDAKDTNRPFDFDHILPHSWIKNKKGVSVRLKNLYNTNGNLRAWPYWLNRGDQDKSPFDKLLIDGNKSLKQSISILENSCCSTEWAEVTDKAKECVRGMNSKEKNLQRKLMNLIVDRNLFLYHKYLQGAERVLQLENTCKAEKVLTFSDVFNGKFIDEDDYVVFYSNDNFENKRYEFKMWGNFTENSDNQKEKFYSLHDKFYIYISTDYLHSQADVPMGFYLEGQYIVTESILLSVSKESFLEMIGELYNKLLLLQKYIRKDIPSEVRNDLAEIFRERINKKKFNQSFL